jgi:hypothetical protein
LATSAIGPGFITQTTQFAAGAAFAFAITVSIVDIAAVERGRDRRVRLRGTSAIACCPALGTCLFSWCWAGCVQHQQRRRAGLIERDARRVAGPGGAVSAIAVAIFLAPRG